MRRARPVLPILLLLAVFFPAGAVAGEPLVIADFEDSTTSPFEAGSGLCVTEENAAHGSRSLAVDGGRWINASPERGLVTDWSDYDVVRLEAYNPTDRNLKFTFQAADSVGGRGYWAWHNRYTALAPGANTVEFAIADMWRGEILRRDIPGMLDTAKVLRVSMQADGPWHLDYFRLEHFSAAPVEVEGLAAFDVGPEGSPCFGGFTPLGEKSEYTREAGFGWTRADFARSADRIHPDNLFRDWLSCRNAELAIDLPDGLYRAHLQLEDPAYWEYMQNYKARTVTAEGAVVVDETMNAEEFLERYFRNEDAEDFPGEDPFEKYVEPRHPWHVFDVEVSDGQLNLAFRSEDTYGNTLSAVVVYPAERAGEGAEFFACVRERRRFDWLQRWKPVSKPPAEPVFPGTLTDDAKRDGYVLYELSPYEGDDAIAYEYVPDEAERLSTLEITAACGEFEPASFGLRPARPLGRVTVSLSAPKSASGATIAPEDMKLLVGRYRFSRHEGNQSGLYAVRERELRVFNRTAADALVVDDSMARRFWITVRVGEDVEPGVYDGAVTVAAEKGGARRIPLRLRVLPFRLPEPDHLFLLYGMAPLPEPYYPSMRAQRRQRIEAVYGDLADHGINYIDRLDLSIDWRGGKAHVTNVDEAEAEMAIRKRFGFREGPVRVNGGCSLEELADALRIRGVPKDEFIEGWHLAVTKLAEERGWPHPYFCYGDEPTVPETLKALTAANDAVHAVSSDIWMGIAYHVRSPESYDLLKSLDVHHLKPFCSVEDFRMAKKAGKFLLNCNVGASRFAYGLKEWRAAKERMTDGCITYSYTGCHVDIYYDLDAREADYNMAPPRSDGTLATTARWERIREGIDDYRYAQAIEALAENASAEPSLRKKALGLMNDAMWIGAMQDDAEATKRAIAWRRAAQEVLSSAVGDPESP